MNTCIEPKILKGFRDFLPSAEIVRRNLTEQIETTFRSFGFVPIDTPALEYAEILLGKGGGETEKQIYRFTDNGGRDVALRFDLTVPFARFTALHKEELIFPFKRYHIAKVWRGENTQRGRYREFTQCDFDIIGSDSPAADFEILLMIRSTLQNLGVNAHIHLNHRGLFNRFLSVVKALDKSVDVLRTVDKISKVGIEETQKSLAILTNDNTAQKILAFIQAGGESSGVQKSFDETLDTLTELAGGPAQDTDRLRLLRQFMQDTGTADSFTLSPSITRGLDYYTGLVFETFLTELPEIGSICSGGRYDNLCGIYTKNQISGVGSSIGLDRMIAALESLGRLPPCPGYAAIAIACVKQEQSGACQSLADKLRQKGIPCEVFLEGSDSTLVKQYVLAEKKGIQYLIIPGENPLSDSQSLRNIAERKNQQFSTVDELLEWIEGESHTPLRRPC